MATKPNPGSSVPEPKKPISVSSLTPALFATRITNANQSLLAGQGVISRVQTVATELKDSSPLLPVDNPDANLPPNEQKVGV